MKSPLLMGSLAAALLWQGSLSAAPSFVYFGTYTSSGASKGIYVSSFDSQTGTIGAPQLAAEITSPSFITLSADGKNLYAVSETGGAGSPGGSVSAFAIDAATGLLKMLNAQPSQGQGPCHVSIDSKGSTVMVANYGSGSCASYSRQADGALSSPVSSHQHEGKSVDPKRQQGPHAHMIMPSPDGSYAYVPDLGLDKIMIYKLDGKGGIKPNTPPFAVTKPGGGPRHFAFHPSEPLAWVINEMGSSVSVFNWDKKSGALAPSQDVSTLPADFKGGNSCAHIECHPNGQYLYGSNRGHDSIATFKISPKTGWVRLVQHTPSGGKTPRNFGIDPSGQWLLAANQGSDNVTVFKINQETGVPEAVGNQIAVGSPVCVKFLIAK